MTSINTLIVHCSDTADNVNFSAKDIHDMHIGFGWDGIGYHKVIKRDGIIENGRPEYWVGAHVKGRNEDSLGVCLIGRKNFNKKQLKSLEKILRNWKEKYPNANILGHYQATKTKKTCPNFDVIEWCKSIGI
jgi:N-acetylmuramoyl-L-alanine amidase